MTVLAEVRHLIRKEIILEWRNRHALNGILLYLVSTIFICYLAVISRQHNISPGTWNALFWIIMLFSAVNAVAKSFIQVAPGRMLYYYTLAGPEAIIISKILYNSVLLAAIGLIGALFYGIVLGNPVSDPGLFILVIILGGSGLASVLTMVSGIASKASHSTMLMAILSFPVLVPLLLLIIKTTGHAIDGLGFPIAFDELAGLAALNLSALAMSWILFPYLWKN
ncbi:MAG TPA: heme exporter protein CcmB [Cyclobacteriaceae bacterium]|nr:heme exporter protein CcmB [Cyclobacteriaceae bacterium]